MKLATNLIFFFDDEVLSSRSSVVCQRLTYQPLLFIFEVLPYFLKFWDICLEFLFYFCEKKIIDGVLLCTAYYE